MSDPSPAPARPRLTDGVIAWSTMLLVLAFMAGLIITGVDVGLINRPPPHPMLLALLIGVICIAAARGLHLWRRSGAADAHIIRRQATLLIAIFWSALLLGAATFAARASGLELAPYVSLAARLLLVGGSVLAAALWLVVEQRAPTSGQDAPAAGADSGAAPAKAVPSMAWGLITMLCGLLLAFFALASGWSSAPTSPFMMQMGTIGLFGGLGFMILGVFALIAPSIRRISGIASVAALFGFIFGTM